jgi:hypothetical protein
MFSLYKTISSEAVPVGVHRPQPVGHGVEWSVPICRFKKKIFFAIKKQKLLYDSYSKDWLDLLNTAWIVRFKRLLTFISKVLMVRLDKVYCYN